MKKSIQQFCAIMAVFLLAIGFVRLADRLDIASKNISFENVRDPSFNVQT